MRVHRNTSLLAWRKSASATDIAASEKKGGCRGAFLLVYALVILAALLGGSVVLAQLALKNLQTIRGAYEATKATFAAESGAECALYWRMRNGARGTYTCGDPPVNGTFQEGGTTQFTVRYPMQGSCVEARVEVNDASHTILSRGYNTCAPQTGHLGIVERGYMITY